MSSNNDQLLKKKLRLLDEIKCNADFIKGTISKVTRKNRIINDVYHLTYKDELQKTRTKYISSKLFAKVKSGIKKMIKIRKIINEISKINIELLKDN